MADQKIQVKCGFFNSVDADRLYTAEDMNRPYKRIITNGVFATPGGTPSTDFQVFAQDGGMNIVVRKGQGLFADKWFESPSDLVITVPANTNIVPRIDSVVIQVDKTMNGRCGNIVYREGTANSTPTPPLIGQTVNVEEYRVANITVAPGVTAVKQSSIEDLRGSAECPWITSLIKQMDTSTLFEQYKSAHEQFYTDSAQEFEEWFDDTKAQADQLTEEANVAIEGANDAAEKATAAGETAKLLALNAANDALEARKTVQAHTQNTAVHVTAADKAKLDGVAKSYVLLWSDNTQVDYREENEPILQELCGLQNGKYHVVLRNGNTEYPLLRREYTAAKGYFYYFGGELSENYTAGEYVIGYKPGNSLEAAVYTVTGNSTVNGLELAENDFRPPTTDLVKMCMDEHTEDTAIHVTAVEKAKWNAGTGGGASYEEATTTVSGLMSKEDKAKLDGVATGANKYVHPSHTAKTSGLYKVTVDGTGHVSNAAVVTKGDITALGIPGQDTTYSPATVSANGLMSKEDKAKLDSHTEDTDIHVTAAERAAWNAGTGSSDSVYCICPTAPGTAAKIATSVSGTFTLKTGAAVDVKFANTNTASPSTLNVDGTGAKTIKIYGTTNAYVNMWREGSVVRFVYDGTNWIMQGAITASTEAFGVVRLSNSVSSTNVSFAATPAAVKVAYDLANEGKTGLDSHTEDTDIHVTAAERAKWNAGTGGASYEEATASASGLMSKEDKAKLDKYPTDYFHPVETVCADYVNENNIWTGIAVDDMYFDDREGFLRFYLGKGIKMSTCTPGGTQIPREGIKLELDMDAIIEAFPDASEVSY